MDTDKLREKNLELATLLDSRRNYERELLILASYSFHDRNNKISLTPGGCDSNTVPVSAKCHLQIVELIESDIERELLIINNKIQSTITDLQNEASQETKTYPKKGGAHSYTEGSESVGDFKKERGYFPQPKPGKKTPNVDADNY